MPHGHALADALRDLGLGAPWRRPCARRRAPLPRRARGRAVATGKWRECAPEPAAPCGHGGGIPGVEGHRHRRVVVRMAGRRARPCPGRSARRGWSRSVIIANGPRLEPVPPPLFPARNTMPRPDPAPADPATAPEPPSKTRRKQAMHALQDLGEALVALDAKRLAELGLPERLADAITTARGIRAHEGPPPADPVHRQADARHRSRTRAADARTLGRGRARRSRAVRGGRALARTAAGRRRRRSIASRTPIPPPTAPRLPRWCAMRGSSVRAADRRIAIARCSAR